MELKAHFSDIHKVIINHLEQAQSEIVAAIAWFTDRDIFDVLCKKAHSGVKVTVALIGDEINQGPGGLSFEKLRSLGGRVIMLPSSGRNEPTMHHKFCVIDSSTVITGSYNWSKKARINDENITVVTDSPNFAGKYLDTFDSLLVRTGQTATVVADSDAAGRRLEMIRNLILLGEQSDITTHVRKLRPLAEALQISQIITFLDAGEYRAALEGIDAYLRKATTLVVAGFADIPRLRFLLESLELRLESLTDEKADLERRLITFNRRHDDALGDLIQRLLMARAELAKLIAANLKDIRGCEEAEDAAKEAEDTYQEYAQQHDELRGSAPLPMLNTDEEQEIKRLYRKTCSLCHPDKFPEERKETATRTFVELKAAYDANNINRMREIHAALTAGGLPVTRSSSLNEAEALKAAIAELEYAIVKLVAELKALQESDAARLVASAGSREEDWQSFFEQHARGLDMELHRVASDIRAMHADEVEAP